jgi:hypothetical protein
VLPGNEVELHFRILRRKVQRLPVPRLGCSMSAKAIEDHGWIIECL